MDSLPLYRQLAAHYVDAIHTGSLKQGDKLPSLRSLMRLHGISPVSYTHLTLPTIYSV